MSLLDTSEEIKNVSQSRKKIRKDEMHCPRNLYVEHVESCRIKLHEKDIMVLSLILV